MPFKIENIRLKDGSEFKPSPVTVIVGPNNCGKTRLLKELDQFILGHHNFDFKILSTMATAKGDFDEIVKGLGVNISSSPDGNNLSLTLRDGYFGTINQNGNKDFFNTLRDDVRNKGILESMQFRDIFGKACFAMIRTEDRLIASKSSSVHPDGAGFLDTIYNGGSDLEETISKYTYQVFGLDIKLDFTIPGKLSIKVGDDFRALPADPRDARELLQQFPLLEDQGDGFRSFATTLLMLLITKRPIILLDEPEAFLHPPQAAALGRIIAEIASESQSIFLSTHSSDFLRGIMGVRGDVNILRLVRNEDGTTGHILDTKEISNILNTPLLNSTRVLDSLFYQGVVIMEGDSDRTFYEKIAKTYFPEDEVHYIHAHNKQTIHKLIGPYVKAAVAFAAILDFDVLRERHDLKTLINATTDATSLERVLELQKVIQDSINKKTAIELYKVLVGQLEVHLQSELKLADIESFEENKEVESEKRIADIKSKIKEVIDTSDKWSVVKLIGSAGLSTEAKSAFEELDSLCQSIGIFIVPCGSLESWLVYHGVSASKNNKSKWISNALDWLEENQPHEMPVRDFIAQIHERFLE